MSTASINKIYEEVRDLPAREQLELVTMVTRNLIAKTDSAKTRSLLELEGLGAEIWKGVDAQRFVDEQRDEWDKRST